MSPRVYTRKFDWDEARARHAAGETYSALAREYGVSPTAVAYACDDDARARQHVIASAWQRSAVCRDCGKTGVHPHHGRCQKCAAVASITTVRESTLHCVTCREWKPDAAFPRNRQEQHRRGHHTQCRVCTTEQRRQWRERYPEKYKAANRRDYERKRARAAA